MENYLNLLATPTWSLRQGLRTNPRNRMDDSRRQLVGDFDGDGRVEMIFSSNDGATLGICSYLSWNDLTANPPYELTYLQNAWANAGPAPLVITSFQQAQIPAADPSVFGPWQMAADDQRCTVDLDGDGRDELLLFNPDTLSIGVSRWSDSAFQFQVLWSTQGSVPASRNSGPHWGLHAEDLFFPARLFGDSSQQILVYRPSTLDIGVLEWTAGQLATTWTGGPKLPGNDSSIAAWALDRNDLFFSCRVSAGPEFVAVFGHSSIGILRYASSGLVVFSNLYVGLGTTSVLVADMDGDGGDEIVLLKKTISQLSIYKWSGSGDINSLYSGSMPWPSEINTISLTRVRLFGTNDSRDQLLLFDAGVWPAFPTIGVFQWDPSDSTVVQIFQPVLENNGWTTTAWIPGSAQIVNNGQIGWEIKGGDQYICADIDGDSAEEIVLVNLDDEWVGWVKWTIANLELQSDSAASILGWNPFILGTVPDSPFPSYQGDQQDIYSYLSGYAITGDENNSGANLRYEYNNSNDVASYGAWIINLQCPPNRNGWDPDAFEAIRTALHAEVNGVAELYSMVSHQQL
jgi:hypothetical protein